MLERAIPVPDEATENVGRRAAARLRLSIPARFITICGTHDSILLDLSQTGARIALETPMAPGAAGYLRVAHLEIFGEAVRCKHGTHGGVNGIAFDELLSHAAVLAVRHHAETLQQRDREALREQVRRWVTGEK